MDTQTASTIRIRGIRDGLAVTLGEGPYEDELNLLAAKLAEKQGFLEGSKVTLAVGDRPLSRADLLATQRTLLEHGLELWAILAEREDTRETAREFGLATRQSGSNTDLNGNVLQTPQDIGPAGTAPPGPAVALYVKETVRSGRSIYHEGPVVVIGDLNPGAEIIAAGDVIVWGKVRGLVHAGALGDPDAVICALDLSPTQLRIADQIAIPPVDRTRPATPEIAAIRDGQIVAEPWRKI